MICIGVSFNSKLLQVRLRNLWTKLIPWNVRLRGDKCFQLLCCVLGDGRGRIWGSDETVKGQEMKKRTKTIYMCVLYMWTKTF